MTWSFMPYFESQDDPAVTQFVFTEDNTLVVADALTEDWVFLTHIPFSDDYFTFTFIVNRNTNEQNVYINGNHVFTGETFYPEFNATWFRIHTFDENASVDVDNMSMTNGIVIPEYYAAIDNTSGTIAPGGSEIVNLSIKTEDLDFGNYDFSINASTNDPDNAIAVTPITLNLPEPRTDIVINEFLANPPGNKDENEFIELLGNPNTDYSALTLLELSSGNSRSAKVQKAIRIGTTDDNGYWLYEATKSLRNSTSTYLLVSGFYGNVGDFLDPDADGDLDSTPWEILVDGIGRGYFKTMNMSMQMLYYHLVGQQKIKLFQELLEFLMDKIQTL